MTVTVGLLRPHPGPARRQPSRPRPVRLPATSGICIVSYVWHIPGICLPYSRNQHIIWNPHHLDENRRFGTYLYILVYTGMYQNEQVHHETFWYVPVCTGIYQTCISKTWYVPVYTVPRNCVFFTLGADLSWFLMHVYTSHVQYNISWRPK